MIEIPSPEWHQKAQCVIEQTPNEVFYPNRSDGFTTRVELARLCVRDCAEAGISAMQVEADKLMKHESVRKAYEHFLLMCELTKDRNDS